MRLLVVTQTIDKQDPVLGFFHAWIEALAPRAEQIQVICLREGYHALPGNVSVHTLGKEHGRPKRAPRLVYAFRFLRLAWKWRREYDAVFVHMNEEYVVIAGLLWRLLGKRIVLWRNFKTGSWMTPLACRLAHAVCYTSPDSYTRRFHNAVEMPIGIDTNLFTPGVPTSRTLLFLGRLDPIKRADLFVSALALLHARGTSCFAELYGHPTNPDSAYARKVRTQAEPLVEAGVLRIHPATVHAETPAVFARAETYVNLTPSGSFDKTIGEAMASGCVVVTANSAVTHLIPEPLQIKHETIEGVAAALTAALELSQFERSRIAALEREFIEREHSLALLVPRLAALLEAKAA